MCCGFVYIVLTVFFKYLHKKFSNLFYVPDKNFLAFCGNYLKSVIEIGN